MTRGLLWFGEDVEVLEAADKLVVFLKVFYLFDKMLKVW